MTRPATPGPLVGGPKPLAARSRRQMSWLRRATYSMAAPIAVAVFRLLWSTYRFEIVGEHHATSPIANGRPLILTLWHDSIFVCSWYFRQLGQLGARVTYLVSPSVDGEFAVRVLDRMHCQVVRGSATRSGVKAMRDMFRAMKKNNASPVILPDGPQGPRHSCKPGSLLLAQMAQALVLPMAAAASRAWELPSWDRLLLPLPLCRVTIVVGEPYEVPAGLDEEELEYERQRLEAQLEGLRQEAEARVASASGTQPS